MPIQVIKKSLAFVSTASTYILVTASVYAQGNTISFSPPPGSVPSDVKAEAVPQLVINLVFGLAIFLAVVYLMFGGIKYMNARGDRVAVESARKHLISAVIGIVIVAGTFLILRVVFQVLGASNPLEEGFKIPNLRDLSK